MGIGRKLPQGPKVNSKRVNENNFLTFHFSSISPQQCLPECACVQFTVMDHDFMLANDFAGEGFLALNTVAGIQGEEVSGFSALRPLRLPLTQPRKGGGNDENRQKPSVDRNINNSHS